MRSPLFTSKRRIRRTSTASTVVKARRNAPPAAGGPVASAEYIGRGRRRSVSSGGRNRGTGVLPRPHSAQLTRRIVLTVLICASLGLITATYRGGVVIHSVQNQVLQVVAPIERGMSRAWDPIAGSWNWIGRLFNATSENPKLKQQNDDLRQQVHALKTAEDQNAEYQSLISFEGNSTVPSDLRRVHGTVIGRQAGPDDPLIIDLGTTQGVHKGDPVMGTGGLIGIVTNASRNVAVVGLINGNDQNVGAKAINESGGAQGVLQAVSSDGAPALRLTSVPQSLEVEIGDDVVTSGFFNPKFALRSKYPANLIIGRVSDVGQSPGDLSKTIQVTPSADFDNIRTVTVLVKRDRRSNQLVVPEDASIGTLPATAETATGR
ncbi:MAG: rod shape-determining protein MreC [Thermoleophilia bacterium]|nr:rod shape-determining protein MreC [Thermoleophilia bacterium]